MVYKCVQYLTQCIASYNSMPVELPVIHRAAYCCPTGLNDLIHGRKSVCVCAREHRQCHFDLTV
jgi:hypothetical protein